MLAVSGTAILLALPALYWEETGANGVPAWIRLPLPINLEQTGWGRNLHFLAAWIFVVNGTLYWLLAIVTGRLSGRLVPERDQLRLGAIADDLRRHLSFKARRGPAPGRYNVTQKAAYLVVLVVLGPVMLLSGLTMSPGVTAAYPELFTLFGGRQSARTVHFLAAIALLAFLAVHVWQLLLNDPARLMRAMTVGGSRPKEGAEP